MISSNTIENYSGCEKNNCASCKGVEDGDACCGGCDRNNNEDCSKCNGCKQGGPNTEGCVWDNSSKPSHSSSKSCGKGPSPPKDYPFCNYDGQCEQTSAIEDCKDNMCYSTGKACEDAQPVITPIRRPIPRSTPGHNTIPKLCIRKQSDIVNNFFVKNNIPIIKCKNCGCLPDSLINIIKQKYPGNTSDIKELVDAQVKKLRKIRKTKIKLS